jgi:hypothetical protein
MTTLVATRETSTSIPAGGLLDSRPSIHSA